MYFFCSHGKPLFKLLFFIVYIKGPWNLRRTKIESRYIRAASLNGRTTRGKRPGAFLAQPRNKAPRGQKATTLPHRTAGEKTSCERHFAPRFSERNIVRTTLKNVGPWAKFALQAALRPTSPKPKQMKCK